MCDIVDKKVRITEHPEMPTTLPKVPPPLPPPAPKFRLIKVMSVIGGKLVVEYPEEEENDTQG